MPANDSYIQDSLEINLFYLRIMKEHALFLQLGFTPRDKELALKAESIRMRMDDLLRQTVQTAKGYISEAALSSGEIYTKYTEEAERQTQALTGVNIDTQLTAQEYSLAGSAQPPASMQGFADRLNDSALSLTDELIRLKERVYNDVMACRMYTAIYPSQIGHIIREAGDYVDMLQRLMHRRFELGPRELADEESFWNQNMQEHAEFIDGLLDPSEVTLKRMARGFTIEFERLYRQAEAAKTSLQTLPALTRRTVPVVQNISNFKAQGTSGILSCKIRSVIAPLLADHVLRESNYYLRILRETLRQ